MAEDVAVVKDDPCNPCCIAWKKKCSKLEKDCSNYKAALPLLKKVTALADTREKEINSLQAEILALRKERDHERARAESEQRDKEQESDKRGFLENQVSELKSEILSLQQKNEDLVNRNGDQDVENLQRRISECGKEINELKKLLLVEKKKAAEGKKFEMDRISAEKKKAAEEKRLADIQRKKDEETGLQFMTLKREVDEARSKLVLEKAKYEDGMKRLKAEKEISKKERERADKEKAKVEDLMKLSEVNSKKAADERNRAEKLSQQLNESKIRLEKLDIGKKYENLKKELHRVRKQLKSEMKKAEEQMSIASAYKSKAMEEKSRGDRLSCELEGNKQKLEKFQDEIEDIVSSMTGFNSFDAESDGSIQLATAEIKLLRKELKFEKTRVKHANKVYKMEIARNQMLQQEVRCIKQEFLKPMKHLDILEKCLFVKSGDANHLEKIGNLDQEDVLIPRIETGLVKPRSALLPASRTGEICSRPITGTDSSLEQGSSRRLLETSAINSSLVSFSDKQLMGSQENGTLSVSTSALLAENENLVLSNDARKACEDKLGVGPGKSVGSPMKNGATEKSGRHQHQKRKRTAGNEHLHSSGKRTHQQALQNLSVMHGMLAGVSLKSPEEEILPAKLQGDADRELLRPHKKKRTSNIDLEMHAAGLKTKLQTLGNEMREVCKSSRATELNASASELTDIRDVVLGNKRNSTRNSDVLGKDYLKLFDLDDENAERGFHEAMKKPLSPLSPALCRIHLPFVGATENEIETTEGNVIPSRSFDVMNSNERTLGSHGSCKSLSVGVCKPHDGLKKNSNVSGDGVSGITNNGFSGQPQNSTMASVVPADNSLICTIPVVHRTPKYCVVSSSSTERGSIYKIFNACSEFVFEISGSCLIERLIKNILLSLQKADGLSSGERGSVLLSLLLQYVPEVAMYETRSVYNLDSHQFMDSFSQQWRAAMDDLDTKRLFREFCDVGELLALLEDLLLNRTIIKYGDVHEMMHLGAKAVCEDECISLSCAEASSNSLITGGLVLASICVSVDKIGFTCEISYHLFSTRKINLSFVLKLLHLFAHLCGPTYFTPEDYGLEMYVLKSLVVFLERLDSSSAENVSYLASAEEIMKISACASCPFSQDVASVDFVVSLLLEKLRSYALSGTEKQHTGPAQLSSVNVPVLHGMTTTDISCHGETDQLNYLFDEQLRCFVDILSLVELVERIMTWSWIFGNIVSPLLQILDSSIPRNLLNAIIAHLGQLGRIGIDAKGYEDSEVGCVRKWLAGFVCRDTFRSYDISVQFVSVAALMELIDKPFEEVISTNSDDSLPKNDSLSVASKWFSSLSKEQQSSFRSLQST